MSEDFCKKDSESHKGKPHSEETKKKIAETLKGKPHSEEHNKKVAEANKGLRKGMHWCVVDGKRVWH